MRLKLQGATSAPKAKCLHSFTCFAATPNTELIDNVIQAEVARLVTSRILYKDCKAGGYNLEGSKASPDKLVRIVLLIALAMITA